jgi:hypothetical protein
MKPLVIFAFTFAFSLQAFQAIATGQQPDRMIYNGDTISIFAEPLEYYAHIDSLRKILQEKKWGWTTACWKGYSADWEIIDNRLYLIAIRSCDYGSANLRGDLKALFGDKCVNGKVEADWFTGEILSPQGKEILYVHSGYFSYYEKELVFDFEKGRLTGTKLYNNSKSKLSAYSQDQELLFKHIYSNIRWDILPKDTALRVTVTFSANENGIVDQAEVWRSGIEIFDKEAIRVVKTIPEWDRLFRREKLERRNWTLGIAFTERNRLIYGNK